MLVELWKEILSLIKYRWVSYSIVSANLKTRYKRSVLGFFWSLLGPILSYTVMAIVFYFGMKVRVDNYFTYLFPALTLFTFFNAGISQASNSLRVNEMYIKKIYLPKIIFPVNSILTESVTFCFNLLAITTIGLAFGKLTIHIDILLLPVYFIPAFLFALGLGMVLSVVTVFFRDVSHMLPVLFQIVLYGSPILYSKEILPLEIQNYLFLNPFYPFFEGLRVCYLGTGVSLSNLLIIWILGIFSLLMGLIVVKKNENRVVFKL